MGDMKMERNGKRRNPHVNRRVQSAAAPVDRWFISSKSGPSSSKPLDTFNDGVEIKL